MDLEARLDALLSSAGIGRERVWSESGADRALAPLLAAADHLAPLRTARPDASFANALEQRLLTQAAARAQSSRATTSAPGSGIPLAVAGQSPRMAYQPSESGGADHAQRNRTAHTPAGSHRHATRRGGIASVPLWTRALAAACVFVALGSALFVAGASAQPGSFLFRLHRAEQWVQVNLASSPEDRARLHLQYASDALASLDRSVASRASGSAYSDALATLQVELGASSAAIEVVAPGTTHDSLAAQLAALQQRARGDLLAALAARNWPDRLATSAMLGSLGESVPQVTGATISEDTGTTSHGTRVVRVVLSGSGFTSGALLVLDGHPRGTVISVTATTLIAEVAVDPASLHLLSAGIENPDGTAAETRNLTHTGAARSSDTPLPRPGATPNTTPKATPDTTPGAGSRGGHGGHG
ncbi:MAG: hypothetical protein ACHQ4H_11420 [Ktedonobacterales bacterium]